MKSTFKVSLLAASMLFVAGTQVSYADAKAQPSTDDEKAAYAMGVSYASGLKQNLSSTQEFGITLDNDFVVQGFSDVFADKASMTTEQANAELSSFGERMNKIAQEKAQKEAAANKAEGDAFRAAYEKEEGVQKTESGILYKVLEKGDGETPTDESGVMANYEGKLVNGEVFDSTAQLNVPAVFPLANVIPGWTEMLKLMKVGDKVEAVIPPEMAYGEMGNQAIGGNSTLVFTIELLEVIPQDKIMERSQQQQQAYMEAMQKQQEAAQ